MSKKFRYFSLLMVLIVFLSIGAICATDVNNNTVAISNSSVSNSIQTVTNDTVTNSVNVCDNSTNAMSNSDGGSSSSSIVSSYNGSSNGLDVESSTISSNNSSSSNGLDVESSTISSNNSVGNSNTVSNINNTVLNTIENCSNVSAVNKQLTTTSVSSALVNTGSNITNLNNNTFGVFLFGSNMNSIDLSKLYANHIGNIFLNYYAIETYGVSAVESFIKKARTYNINVYIWMQCFYDGGFINPATCGQSYWTQKINEAKSYAELQGVAGIALDYLRFPGTAYKYSNGTKSINLFTKMLTAAVKEINSNIKVAAIIMPETSSNAYYYGQDSDQLGNIVDIIIPMVYKGNYGESDSWIKSTSTYFKSHSGNAEVWTALQTYDSDSNVVKLSSSVLSTDSQYALNGGADGVVYFRYALFNIFNMTSLSGGISSMDSSKTNSSSSTNSSNPTSFTISQIVDAARTVRAYYVANGRLPSSVTVGSVKVSLAQFLYYESRAISQLGSGSTASIAVVRSLSEPSSPNLGDSINGNLSKSGYVDSATRTYKFILNYNQGPNYSSTTIGKVSYNRLIEAFSAILDYYGTYNQLPTYVTVKYNSKTTTSTNTTNTNSNNTNPTSFTISQIVDAAKVVKEYYVANGRLPSSVTVGSVKVSLAQFLYYESRAISQLGSGSTASIAVVRSLSEPSSPNSGDSVNGKLYKAGYVDSATRTYKFILNYNQGPNYSSTTIGKVSYNRLIEAFSAILDYYGTYNQLPTYVTVKYNSKTTTSTYSNVPTSFTISQIVDAAKVVKEYYVANGRLPSSVTVGSVKVSLAQFLYYESRAISQLGSGSTASIAVVKSLSEPSSPNLGDSINGNLSKSGYVDSATRTYKFILNYNQGPNYSTTTLGRVSYNKLIETFADILVSYGNNNKLPTSTVVNTNEVVGNYTYFTVVSTGLDGTYVEGNKFGVALKDALGNAVNNRSVIVNLNNRVYNLVTDNDGVVYVIIPVLNNGNYNVSYSYTDSNSKLSSNGSTVIKVIKNLTTISGKDLNTTTNSGAKFNVTLKDAFGNAIANQNVQFKLNNSNIIYNATTNSNGVASLAINLNSGDYTITYSFITNNNYPGSNGTSKIHVVDVVPTSLSIAQIVDAAKLVKEYYATNGKLPSSVTVGSVKVSLAQFLYYESRAISQLGSGNTASIAIVDSLDEPSSPNLGDSVNGNLSEEDYVDSATRTYKFILNYEQGPNYSTTTLGKVSYNILIDAFSVVLDYYGTNSKLPAYVTIKNNITTTVNGGSNSSNNNTSNSKYFTINQIVDAAKLVKEYYATNDKLPSTVSIGSVKVSLAQFLYYESKAISQLDSGDISNIAIIDSLDEPSSPNTGDSISENLNRADYVDSATRTYKFILNYEQGPNYSTTAVGKVSYNALIEAFSRVLAYYGNNNQLPNYVVIDTTDSNGGSSNANTSSITALAVSLTSGLSSDYDKAVAMFNWVRDNVVYDYYYNSQQGAALTLTKRSGNCCDQSNLYVAMCRAVGVTIRYVHGYCHFSDGWYGHVWTEVYVNGQWYSADCISTRNTFGVINNWNTDTATIYNRYTTLPF